MLLRGLSWLMFLQLVGTAINVLFVPILPGPIIGLLLLFALLVFRGEVGEPLSLAASTLLRYLPLLLIPTAVSVMLYIDILHDDLWAISAAMLLSFLLSFLFTGWLMQKLIERQQDKP